jgi:beta-glucanase (GH16 family)
MRVLIAVLAGLAIGVGSSVTASGSGMPKRSAGTLTFGTTSVASFTTRSNGSYSTTFQVPSGYSGATTVHAAVRTTSATAFTVTTSGPPPPPVGNYQLKLDDEFDSIDSKWGYRFWWNGDGFWPTHELEVYRPANCAARGGVLTETARPEAGLTNFVGSSTHSDGEPFQYTSCFMSTGGVEGVSPVAYAFTYGYVEARIWVSAGNGIWPGFWMAGLNDDGTHNDSLGEMDIMEVRGFEPNVLQMHYLQNGQNVSGGTYTNPTPLSDGWHTYALDWQPGKLTWYLDGVARHTYTGTNVDGHAHYVMLNLAVGGSQSWVGAPDASTPFPSVTRVDWLRVWQ